MTAPVFGPPGNQSLRPAAFGDLPGFENDDLLAAWRVLTKSCEFLLSDRQALRPAAMPSDQFWSTCLNVAQTTQPQSQAEAVRLWTTRFTPWQIAAQDDSGASGFLTGYYEPIVDGALEKSEAFSEPVLGFPDNPPSIWPDRAAIDAGALADRCKPIVWLRDAIEVFMMQVQGSGRVRLPDGTSLRLTYAGRNGLPYTSIGRILIGEFQINPDRASLDGLKEWVRRHGQNPGDEGRNLLHRNRSYVFFTLNNILHESDGPIGGQGLPLTPLRSAAVDRSVWPYGLPFWIDADIPWRGPDGSAFQRLMIAQDTGSAIVGPSRFDLYFGSGDAAGVSAARIRHTCRAYVLLPQGARP